MGKAAVTWFHAHFFLHMAIDDRNHAQLVGEPRPQRVGADAVWDDRKVSVCIGISLEVQLEILPHR